MNRLDNLPLRQNVNLVRLKKNLYLFFKKLKKMTFLFISVINI